MKKVFKKNQLIITALALMIAVAGYLSFTDKNGKDEKVAMEASADTADLSYEISAEDDLAEADILLIRKITVVKLYQRQTVWLKRALRTRAKPSWQAAAWIMRQK